MDNLRGSIFMVIAMVAFALEDMFIKGASSSLPLGQIVTFFGIGGTLCFITLALKNNESVFHEDTFSRPIICRVICEVAGRLFFTLAITFTPLSSASAILQATPLVVVLGSAVFFKEKVSLKRWIAIIVGFIGVLLILQPSPEHFEVASVLAILGTIGFAGRDLATRAAPPTLSNIQLGIYGFIILIPVGLIMSPFTGGFTWPELSSAIMVIGAIAFGGSAYFALTVAMRTGEISVVTPFRYSRLLFAVGIGMFAFNEQLEFTTIAGSIIVIASGIYSLLEKQNISERSQAPTG